MPKNKIGGKSHRKFANKNNNDDFKTNLRYSKDKDELYARVIKLFGNGMADVICSDKKTRLLQIRKKFRGRNKRDNVIVQDSLILVGIRSWEVLNEKKKEKADLLYVYSQNQYESLKELPDIYNILPGNNSTTNSGGFEFTDKPTWLIKQEEEDEVAREAGGSARLCGANVVSKSNFDWNLDDSDDMDCFINEI